jgi:hypothetical protein
MAAQSAQQDYTKAPRLIQAGRFIFVIAAG